LEKLVRLSEGFREGYCKSMMARKITKRLKISSPIISCNILNGAKYTLVVL
jgi:hypothetical protein